MKAVVLGAGAMGKIVIRDLLEFSEPGDHIVVADYQEQAAKDYLKQVKGVQRRKKLPAMLSSAQVDATDVASTAKLLQGSFVVINCVQYQLNLKIMQAALTAGCHYIDLGGLFHVTKKQLKLSNAFRKRGLTALLGMGAAPGITNILATLGAEKLDQVTEIHARLASKDLSKYSSLPALPVSYSLQTILEEFSLKPAVFTRGRMRFVNPMTGNVAHVFPKPVGTQYPMYTLHSETLTLPQSFRKKGVKEVSFKIAFDPTFTDRVRFLRDFGLASSKEMQIGKNKVKPIEVVNRIAMSQPSPKLQGKLRQHEVVRTVVKGSANGKKWTQIWDCHSRGLPEWGFGTDVNTGCPPAIAARMLWRGEIKDRGAVPPETSVPAKIFLRELKKRKMWCKQRQVPNWEYRV